MDTTLSLQATVESMAKPEESNKNMLYKLAFFTGLLRE
ncbi:hypothetical protein A1E_01910 [Rickettsia canadensis str. McKiel]|uniref:Uncharacterized protein n=1 Tax=Rickettsia canadensis (strain McKiel) TaxID=293613 RepID=A8EY94_RICCK|nr:hypothetical protein A1E_01910 [Rickettsia canadensis str. McKiel]